VSILHPPSSPRKEGSQTVGNALKFHPDTSSNHPINPQTKSKQTSFPQVRRWGEGGYREVLGSSRSPPKPASLVAVAVQSSEPMCLLIPILTSSSFGSKLASSSVIIVGSRLSKIATKSASEPSQPATHSCSKPCRDERKEGSVGSRCRGMRSEQNLRTFPQNADQNSSTQMPVE